MTTRRFDARGLEGALRVAQAAFAARGAGESETWLLPSGRHAIAAPLALGAAGLHLTLRGSPGSVLALGPGASLAVTGGRLVLGGLTVEGGDAPVALDLAAGLTLRGAGLTIRGQDGADVTALRIAAPSARLEAVSVGRISGTGSVRGIDARGCADCELADSSVTEIAGAAVTGIDARGVANLAAEACRISGLAGVDAAAGVDVSGSHARLSGLSVSGVTVTGGPAVGLSVRASDSAVIEDLAVEGLSGAGTPGLPFADVAGDGAAGLRLSAAAGRVADVRVEDLTASAGRAVALRLPDGFPVSGLSVGRSLDGADLSAALAEAQADLPDVPPGATVEWRLPAGVHHLSAGLALGQAGRGLTLRGAPGPAGGTTLDFAAAGGGPIPGDLVALRVTGTDVTLDMLSLGALATGGLTGVSAAATGRVVLTELRLRDLIAASVTGALAEGAAAELHDISIEGLRAEAGDTTGLRLETGPAVVSELLVDDLAATGSVTGLDLRGSSDMHLSASRVSDLSGAAALGAVAVADGPAEAALSILDLRVSRIEAGGPGTLAAGLAVIARGDAELRAVAAVGVAGPRAIGALVSATGSIDWLAGELRDIFGRAGGAAGLRVAATARPARDDGAPGIALRDIFCEAVRGDQPSGQAAPPNSWLSAAPTLAEDLLAGGLAALPAPGQAGHLEEILGIAVHAPVSDFAPWIGGADPGSVAVENCVIRRVSGTALQLDCALRDVSFRGCECWTSVAGGWIDAERVTLANVTSDRMVTGIACNQCEVTAVNSVITRVANGPGLLTGPGGEIAGGAVFSALGTAPLSPEPAPLPYVDAGPGTPVPPSVIAGALAPVTEIDLALRPDAGLHEQAIAVPGDDPEAPVHVGAVPPGGATHCILLDPAPPPAPPPVPAPEPSPFADYLSRDSRAFLSMMLARASVVMPEWTTRTPADFTTMLMETLAAELDQAAYRQEEAVANGYLSTATLRRAVEDHARLVDHRPDPGQSASVMLRFSVIDAAALGLAAEFAAGGTLTIPRDTLAVNPDASDISLIFATEEDLVYDPLLDALELHEDGEIEAGGLSAQIAGDLADRLTGRWLTVTGSDAEGAPLPAHVVRVVGTGQGADRTLVAWDPRRPAPARYAPGRTMIRGNVVPAHHGVPLRPLAEGVEAEQSAADPLAPWRAMLRLSVPAPAGRLAEVTLPVGPVSRQSAGWPMPGATTRIGRPDISASLDGIALAVVDDLSDAARSDPRMALRPTREGRAGIAIAGAGDGGTLELALRVGLGVVGNVGAQALTRVLMFGKGAELDGLLADRADRLDVLFGAIAVTNDLPALGGRDPRGLETLRAEAPLSQRRALSAVAPRDYERLLGALREVAGVRARAADTGLARVIHVTALLTDEDELTRPELGEVREAERFRRWALARRRLEEIRLMGFDVVLVPPDFVPLDIDLSVDVEDWANADTARRRIEAALCGPGGLFDPDTIGLGGDVTPDAIQRAVLSVEGVRAARLLRLRRLAPHAPDYARAAQMPIGDTEVAVLDRPYGGPDGILTITTCGGMP